MFFFKIFLLGFFGFLVHYWELGLTVLAGTRTWVAAAFSWAIHLNSWGFNNQHVFCNFKKVVYPKFTEIKVLTELVMQKVSSFKRVLRNLEAHSPQTASEKLINVVIIFTDFLFILIKKHFNFKTLSHKHYFQISCQAQEVINYCCCISVIFFNICCFFPWHMGPNSVSIVGHNFR